MNAPDKHATLAHYQAQADYVKASNALTPANDCQFHDAELAGAPVLVEWSQDGWPADEDGPAVFYACIQRVLINGHFIKADKLPDCFAEILSDWADEIEACEKDRGAEMALSLQIDAYQSRVSV